jgi:hypothetical protein
LYSGEDGAGQKNNGGGSEKAIKESTIGGVEIEGRKCVRNRNKTKQK